MNHEKFRTLRYGTVIKTLFADGLDRWQYELALSQDPHSTWAGPGWFYLPLIERSLSITNETNWRNSLSTHMKMSH